MNRLVTWLDDVITRKRWLLHVMFWAAILLLYGIFFGRRNNNYLQTLFFVGLLMPVVIGATYFFNYYLIPRFIITGRYRLFILYSFYTILTALFLEMMVALLTFLVMAELRVHNMSPASVDIFFLLSSFLVVVFLGVAIKMVSFWRQSKDDYQTLALERIEMELKFLKAQLNPHFLFNTLNNLYYLTTEKSDKAPQAILQLSEMLDYVMHSSKSTFVPLEKELKQVENYIALELLRYEDRVQIITKFSGDLNEYEIGPMILITLIENAFKHGVMPIVGKAWINFIVEEKQGSLTISISNTANNTKPGNGIGLENLRSQLSHLYKNDYQLNVDNSKANEFSVNLILNHKK
jgi:sensor histidine kinase YesM